MIYAAVDIMAMLSLGPTCPIRYQNDAYLSQKASEKHQMVAQDDSKHRQILSSDKSKVVVVAVFSWFLLMFALSQVIFNVENS